jgi:ribosome-associated toxin RatA of RatAB toxin-antitoxin module
MFSLVDDIESYPDFLPWCGGAEVHFRQDNVVEATLELRRGRLSKHFRTRNTATDRQSIAMQLVDGPFRHLSGVWSFTQLGDSGSKVALELEFEFSNRLIDAMLGSYFEDTCNSLVDAFTRRADAIFDDSS